MAQKNETNCLDRPKLWIIKEKNLNIPTELTVIHEKIKYWCDFIDKINYILLAFVALNGLR